MKLVDTHSHLYAEEFDLDSAKVVADAFRLGVESIYLPNVDSRSIERMLKLEAQYPNACFAMMGLHPCSVNLNYTEELSVVRSWLDRRKFVAIGEIGIDLYWDKTFIDQQKIAFKQQINWAIEFNLPIVIHCRDAFEEILEILESFEKLPKGIFHCFSGSAEQAQRILKLNSFKLGIGGVLTFKNSGLDKVIEQISIEHLVLETDSPYLAPVPHRGKRNESAYLFIIAKKLAEIKNLSLDEVASITSVNARSIFC